VFKKFSHCQPRNQERLKNYRRKSRLYGGRINPLHKITSPSATPLQSSLNQSPLLEIDPIDLLSATNDATVMTPQVESTSAKDNKMQDIMEMVLTGNKEKIQSKKEFMEALKKINPDNFVEYLKNMGEKMFDDKNVEDSTTTNATTTTTTTTTTTNTTQLATPITTPMDNPFLDLNINLINSPINPTTPSPDMISPIQSNLNVLDLLNNTPKDDVVTNTPAMNVFPDPLIVAQDEINPFKSPAPVETTSVVPSPNIQNSMNLLAPSPIMQSPLVSSLLVDATPVQQTMQSPLIASLLADTPSQQMMQSPIISSLLADTPSQQMMQSPLVSSLLADTPSQQTIQSPLISSLLSNTPVQPTIQSPLVSSLINDVTPVQPTVSDFSDILNTITHQSAVVSPINPPESSFQNTIDSILLSSPAIQDQSATPFTLPIDSTPAIPNESFINVNSILPPTSSLLSGEGLLGSGADIPLNDEVNNDNNLEKVDLIMKAMNDLIQNNRDTPSSTSTSVDECDASFPSLERINKCMVDENEFDFTNDNITKLVRLAPVEVVQEDVIELEKLALQKRGKGRPRKPRKFSICPFANCHKKFNREFNLKEHVRIHNPKRNKEFVCHLCNEGFYSSSVLSRHISSIHEGEKFFCKNCGKKFNRKDALHRHEKISCHMAN